MTTLMAASTAPPPVPGRATGATRPSAVRFDGVTRHFGATVALDAIDLEIAPGETVALLGPNGAGKSTAIGLMLGLLDPTSGNVRVLDDEPHAAVRSGAVGAMLQESGLPIFARVGELIELVRHLSPRPMPTDAVLARAGLTALADRPTESLSGGETQRVRFAMAIAGDPDLLFLDEPTVAMDVESRRSFWSDMRAFAAEGRTILFATHYLEEADQVADRIVVLDRGRIVADGTAASIKNASSSRHVRFRSAAPDQAFLAALPGAAAVDIAGSRVDIATADSDATARALHRSDLEVRDLEISGPDLEAAFLALTGGDRTAATTREIHR
jgi:ABC-2 type transport system ATP-binding protein